MKVYTIAGVIRINKNTYTDYIGAFKSFREAKLYLKDEMFDKYIMIHEDGKVKVKPQIPADDINYLLSMVSINLAKLMKNQNASYVVIPESICIKDGVSFNCCKYAKGETEEVINISFTIIETEELAIMNHQSGPDIFIFPTKDKVKLPVGNHITGYKIVYDGENIKLNKENREVTIDTHLIFLIPSEYTTTFDPNDALIDNSMIAQCYTKSNNFMDSLKITLKRIRNDENTSFVDNGAILGDLYIIKKKNDTYNIDNDENTSSEEEHTVGTFDVYAEEQM